MRVMYSHCCGLDVHKIILSGERFLHFQLNRNSRSRQPSNAVLPKSQRLSPKEFWSAWKIVEVRHRRGALQTQACALDCPTGLISNPSADTASHHSFVARL
jgi:hypothetical protein